MYSNKKEFEFRVIWRKKNPETLFPFEELEKKPKWKQKAPNLSCGWRSRYTAHIRTDYSLTEQRAFGYPGWKRETQHGKLTPTEEPDSPWQLRLFDIQRQFLKAARCLTTEISLLRLWPALLHSQLLSQRDSYKESVVRENMSPVITAGMCEAPGNSSSSVLEASLKVTEGMAARLGVYPNEQKRKHSCSLMYEKLRPEILTD